MEPCCFSPLVMSEAVMKRMRTLCIHLCLRVFVCRKAKSVLVTNWVRGAGVVFVKVSHLGGVFVYVRNFQELKSGSGSYH